MNNVENWYLNKLKELSESNPESYSNDDSELETNEEIEKHEFTNAMGCKNHEDIKREINEANLILDNLNFKKYSNISQIDIKTIGLNIFNRLQNKETIKCFVCDGNMVIRKNKKLDIFFIGCSNFPKCKFNFPISKTYDEYLKDTPQII